MDVPPQPTSRIPGFYNLSQGERLARLKEVAGLTTELLAALSGEAGLDAELAGQMVENAIGIFGLPLGVAVNFQINSRDVLVPMAIEEPSVVAGASFMAKLARAGGGFSCQADPSDMIAQIQLMDVPDPAAAGEAVLAAKDSILADVAEVDPTLKRLGGGPRDLEVRILETTPAGPMLIVHLIIDTLDAMGANTVNTAAERVSPRLEALTGGRVHLRILSNLADRRLSRAACRIPVEVLAFGDFSGEQVRDGIVDAWAFAEADPYRAATHNKGIMNGIDAVVIATGNDWRAVEAGAHAYAARGGRYTSLSRWSVNARQELQGELELPLAVGTIGGATRVHPAARACLELMQVENARQLAEIIAAVGLAQNLAALRALATEGIQRGHMGLHARQLALAAGALPDQAEAIAARLVEEQDITLVRAQALVRQGVRGANEHPPEGLNQ
jgi:hydroxymethylglutaryl-CoA reductase